AAAGRPVPLRHGRRLPPRGRRPGARAPLLRADRRSDGRACVRAASLRAGGPPYRDTRTVMKTPAAILVETGRPLVVEDLEVPRLRPGQVLVEVRYSGVCHTQVLEHRGHRGPDRFLPHCLGHEGSGVVREVGPGVDRVKPGDHAVLSWIKGAGADVTGTVYGWGGRQVNAGAITTFSRYAVLSANRRTRLPEAVPLREAALLGCAVATGLGSVLNTGEAGPGRSAVVFGAGGVGLCALAGLALAGCAPILAVDVVPGRLELVSRVGATHRIDATQ